MNYPQLYELANEKHSRLQRELLGPVAESLYARSARRGLFFRLRAWVTRRCAALHSLSNIQVGRGVYVGQRTVLLKEIIGSESRSGDFDAHFHPRRAHIEERWIAVAKARLMGLALPPVDLVQVGEGYYVRDGHHRVSVARALGEAYIDAIVVAVG
jgi:hypothetical protein